MWVIIVVVMQLIGAGLFAPDVVSPNGPCDGPSIIGEDKSPSQPTEWRR